MKMKTDAAHKKRENWPRVRVVSPVDVNFVINPYVAIGLGIFDPPRRTFYPVAL